MTLASLFADAYANAIGRPRAIEGEKTVVADGLLASMVRPNQGGVYFLPVDEIIRRKGWKVYNEMLHDDQVKECLAFKKILIAGRTWELKAADETALAKEVAKYAQDALCAINMDHVFAETLTALEYGYSAAEIVWTRKPTDATKYPLLSATSSQGVTLAKIAHRDPEQLYLQMDPHGNFLGIKQLSMGQDINLGPENVMLFTHNKRFGNLYGDSDLRAAYRSWWAKKFIINFWNVYLERMGSPMTMIKYPTGASDDLKAVLKSILLNLGSKTEVLVPEGVDVELVEAKRAGNADYAASLGYHNGSIARAILMSGLFGTGGADGGQGRGSDSQSFLQLRILFKMADGISKQLSEALMCQVVQQIVAFNYGPDAPMPTFIWQDYGQFEGMKIADEIRQLHVAGIIDMDQTDVDYVRSVLGLPMRGGDGTPDKVLRPAAVPLSGGGGAPPPAGQGNDRADKGGSAEDDSTGSTHAEKPGKFKLALREWLGGDE